MDHHNNDAPLYSYPFFAFLGEWLIFVVTCFIALFFFPLTPPFTLHSISTTSSALNVTAENHFTTNLGVGILVDDSIPLMGSNIYYDSLHLSIFQGQENLSTFSFPSSSTSFQQQHEEPTKNEIQAKYQNLSLKVDEWGNDVDAVKVDEWGNDVDVVKVDGKSSCGFVYLDLWFSANARYTMQPMWQIAAIRDKLQGHCGEVKVERCSSSSDTNTVLVLHSFLASCDVHSAVFHKVKLFLFMLLILLLVTAVALPSSLSNSFALPHFNFSTLYFHFLPFFG